MNLFILHDDPTVAAQMQCDKHVVKMIIESAQMLSTAHRLLDGTVEIGPSKSGKTMQKQYRLLEDPEMDQMIYKAVHRGHPCTVWTMESSENYKWHWQHFDALCEEYTYRYGKIHKSSLLKSPLWCLPDNIPWGNLTPFKLAMQANPECMIQDDPVQSYRLFYQTKQSRFKMNWTKREQPEWFNNV